jgi:hypothetical protein
MAYILTGASPLRAGLWVAILIATTGSPLFAADPTTTPAAKEPATQPAVDHGSPDKTWSSICAAVRAGDHEAFRACCYNHNEISQLFIDAYGDTIMTFYQLGQASAELGDEGKKMGTEFEKAYTDLVKIGENRKVDADEETALWIQVNPAAREASPHVLYFRRVNGQWLLDTNRSYSLDSADGRKIAEGFLADTGPRLKLLKAVIADLHARKITTIDQLRDRLGTKMQ